MSTRKVRSDVAVVLAAVEPGNEEQLSTDPVLAALADARARRDHADEVIRLLLAYARRFVYPHPYTLGELSSATGLSTSGVRTAYGPEDVDKVAKATGMEPVDQQGEDR
jgi:hypothetical protein